MQGEPTGCATRCGVGAGQSGTPGAVTCTTSSCDADTKRDPKQCPKTADCGTLILVVVYYCCARALMFCVSLFMIKYYCYFEHNSGCNVCEADVPNC